MFDELELRSRGHAWHSFHPPDHHKGVDRHLVGTDVGYSLNIVGESGRILIRKTGHHVDIHPQPQRASELDEGAYLLMGRHGSSCFAYHAFRETFHAETHLGEADVSQPV